jgi:hypothetical protein
MTKLIEWAGLLLFVLAGGYYWSLFMRVSRRKLDLSPLVLSGMALVCAFVFGERLFPAPARMLEPWALWLGLVVSALTVASIFSIESQRP